MDAVTIKVTKHDLDFLVWAVEAYVARAGGAAYDPYPMTSKSVLRTLKDARRPKANEPDLKPQGIDMTPEAKVARGLNSAGYILEDIGGTEVFRGSMDEIMAHIHQNHPFSWHNALAYQGYRLRAI